MVPSYRSVIVSTCFALWLGAAALACGTFTPRQLGPDVDLPPADSPMVVAQASARSHRTDSDSLQATAANASLIETPVTLAKR
jgi:hypothetical protein